MTPDEFEQLERDLLLNRPFRDSLLLDDTFGDEWLKRLLRALHDNTTAEEVTLEYVLTSIDLVDSVARMIRNNRGVRTLGVRGDCIHEPGALFDALNDNATITRVEIYGVPFDDDDVQMACDALVDHASVRELRMGAMGRSDNMHAIVAGLIARTRTIEELTIGGDWITADDAAVLADAIRRNESIRRLYIGEAGLDGSSVGAITRALATRADFQKFSVSLNEIGEEGGRHLADLIRMSPSITHIEANMCGIGNDGVRELANAMSHNRTLVSVSFYGSGATETVSMMARVLRSNSSIVELYFDGSTDSRIIKGLLLQNRQLAEVRGRVRHALITCWVRAQRHDVRPPSVFDRLPAGLVDVIARSVTRDDRPSPLNEWSAVERARWESNEPPVDPHALTGRARSAPGDGRGKRTRH